MGVWCSGITFALHAKGPGFEPRLLHIPFAFNIFNQYQLNHSHIQCSTSFFAANWTLLRVFQPFIQTFRVILMVA